MRSCLVFGSVFLTLAFGVVVHSVEMQPARPNIDLVGDPVWSAELRALRERTVTLRNLYAGLVFGDGFETGDLTKWVVD